MSAAVGTLSGPLHGGAPARVLPMLDAVAESRRRRRGTSGTCSTAASGSWASATASTAPRIRGRACCAGRRRSSARRASRWRGARAGGAGRAAGEVPDRPLETNVEFWAAVVLDIAEIPPELHAGDVRLRPGRGLVGAHPRAAAHRPADPAVGAVRRARPALDLGAGVGVTRSRRRRPRPTRSPRRATSVRCRSCGRSGTRSSSPRPGRRTFASVRSPSGRSRSSASARRSSCCGAGSTIRARRCAARRCSRSKGCRATTRA